MTLEEATYWYQSLATSLDRAGVKIRLYNCYPDVTDEKVAFVMAVRDEQERKPLPGSAP